MSNENNQKMGPRGSKTSSRALVLGTEIRQAIRNRLLKSRSSWMDENKKKWSPKIPKTNSKIQGLSSCWGFFAAPLGCTEFL